MKTRSIGLFLPYLFLFLISVAISGCKGEDEKDYVEWPKGSFDQASLQNLGGFFEQKPTLIAAVGLSSRDYEAFSTDSAWSLNTANRNKLKQLRESIARPSGRTLLQKVIPLQDVAIYMNNTYGGTVGGFVTVAADSKALTTMHDVYYGLRLDYSGTKFLPEGGGYAVIRFTSGKADKLDIPYCLEMGGSNAHAWPETGGGFTASTLGDGGVPEYAFSNYYAPNQGAELYEVTPLGNELLRATFVGTKWVTKEPMTRSLVSSENPIRNGLYGKLGEVFYPLLSYNGGKTNIQLSEEKEEAYSGQTYYIRTLGDYQGCTLRVWNGSDGTYFVTTTDPATARRCGFTTVERNLFGVKVRQSAVLNVRERITNE